MSQMEARLASMNLKSPGVKSNMPSPPFVCTFHTNANPNYTNPTLSTRAPPSHLRIRPISSVTPATPAPPSPSNGPTESRRQCRPSYLRTGPRRRRGWYLGEFARPGRGMGQFLHIRYIHRAQVVPPQNTDFSGFA